MKKTKKIKPKVNDYFVEDNMRFRVMRKAQALAIQNTFIADCKYKEHATMIVEALNKSEGTSPAYFPQIRKRRNEHRSPTNDA